MPGTAYTSSITGIYGAQASASYAGQTEGQRLTSQGSAPDGSAASPANQTPIFSGLGKTVFGQPVGAWFIIALLTIGIYALIHKHVAGVESELATPRVGIGSFFSIGVQATLFLFLIKAVSKLYPIPGVSAVVAGA